MITIISVNSAIIHVITASEGRVTIAGAVKQAATTPITPALALLASMKLKSIVIHVIPSAQPVTLLTLIAQVVQSRENFKIIHVCAMTVIMLMA
jgi:hypothetical protein